MNNEIILFKSLGNDKGSLISLEENKNIPFKIKRVYYIFNLKENIKRGFHAHKNLKQIAICITGSCKFLLDDGKNKENILLDSPNKGLLIKNMIWHEMYDFSDNCVLVILANNIYDENDYIRNYNNFLNMINNPV